MPTCPNCGHEYKADDTFCPNCGAALGDQTPGPPSPDWAAPGAYPPPPPGYGYPPQGYPNAAASDKRVVAGILGILLGAWGVHRFYLNDVGGGILRIVITLATCGIGGVIGLIEGIIYLTKTDQEFYQMYIVDRKEWF
jgi:TM2 domain-containing membrane protein YozV